MNWQDIASVATTLFLVIDPLGNVPIYNGVLSRFNVRQRAVIAARELTFALIILFGFLFLGNATLGFLGLSPSSLSIAGGVLLFVISLRMIFPRPSSADAGVVEDPFIVPLAIPAVAGPSTMAILLLLSSREPGRMAEWSLALLIAWAASTLILVASPFVLRVLGTRGSRALERLMGMILVILATQMLLNGVRDFVGSL